MAVEPKRNFGYDCPLPLEVCTEILTRLPVKSILRFMSVCKSWYSLVSCPIFISDYSLRNLNKYGNRVLLQTYDPIRDCPSFSSHDESFMESREHDEVPEAFLGQSAKILGSCNGLICLFKYEAVDKRVCNKNMLISFLIWNPTIRKVVELPSPPVCRLRINRSYFGFGFDFKTGDYKVLCTRAISVDSRVYENVYEIFDLRNGVWREISPPPYSWNVQDVAPECYLDGAVHWTGSRHTWSSHMVLLSFDMSDEIFREIGLPDCAEFVWDGDYGDYSTRIETRSVAFRGLVHVIVWKMERNDFGFMIMTGCSVWAMKEYGVTESWTKLFNIDLKIIGVCLGSDPNNFRLWENGGVLMVRDLSVYIFVKAQELVLYDTESGKCKQLISLTTGIRNICLYEESLVLL